MNRLPFVLCLIAMITISCREKKGGDDSAKYRQYYVKGEQLFMTKCSNCHQQDGSGLGRIYPPLNISDYMENNRNEVLCIMRYGREGELTVNGISYNMAMPPMPELTDLEIAQIATYIYNTWSHDEGLIDVKEASVVLDKCN